METFINRFATPLTTGLFAVSAVSGVALFFHWLPGTFHGMHEWLSVVLLAPFILHFWKNWRAVVGYAKRGHLVIPLVACLVVAVPFAVAGQVRGGRGGNPAFKTIALMTQARVSDLAPILKTTPEALVAALNQRGYKDVAADRTLDAVAASSGVPASQILIAVMPAR